MRDIDRRIDEDILGKGRKTRALKEKIKEGFLPFLINAYLGSFSVGLIFLVFECAYGIRNEAAPYAGISLFLISLISALIICKYYQPDPPDQAEKMSPEAQALLASGDSCPPD